MAKRSKPAKRTATRTPPVSAVATLLSGAIVSDVIQRTPSRTQRTQDLSLAGELTTVNRAIVDTASGRVGPMHDLLKSARVRDSRQDTVCSARVHALGRPWVLNPPVGEEKTREGMLIADRVRRILGETPGFAKLCADLGHGILEGAAEAEHHWRKNARGEVVSVPEWHHPNRFAWNIETEQLCWFEANARDPRARAFPGIPLAEYPGKFIVHAPKAGTSNYPWLRGVQRPRAIGSVLKRLATRWGMKALERWGQPQVFVSGRDGEAIEVNDEMMAALRALGADWHARFPEGIEPKTIPATLSELHLRWIELGNIEDAVAILGQNLSTEVTGGSFAAAMAHRYVRLDILAADLAELAETLIDQWIRLIVEYNWPGAPVPVLDFILAPKGEITVAHYQAGLFSADEVRSSMGADPEPDGKGGRYYVAPTPAVATFSATLAAPPGGAVADAPFAMTPRSATATGTTPTNSRSTHPLATSLLRR